MAVLGREEPRLGTLPLRVLTPRSSKGFALIAFAEKIGCPLLPWQQQAAIRALELNEDGTYRFKTIVILVGRQSGKTYLLKVWSLWRMIEDGAALVLGTAQDLGVAVEVWQGAIDIAEDASLGIAKKRYQNGQQEFRLANGARYKLCATTRSAGRGLSVDMLVLDEIREQRDWLAWAALSKTTLARASGQIVCISNAGDDESVVLNSLRDAALTGRDPSMCILEWSAPDNCPVSDPEMWSYGCPALGHTVTEQAIRSALATDPPALFRTEVLCQRVAAMEAALSESGWAHGADPQGSIAPYRGKLALGIDLAPDGAHVALVAAAGLDGGLYRIEAIASWSSTSAARAELPGLLGKLAPTALAWFPAGPANALAPMIRALPYSVELRGTTMASACMGFAEAIAAGRVMHNSNALLDGQVATAGKQVSGDGFSFTRKGAGNCNAVYAAAGAIYVTAVEIAKPERAAAWVL